MDGFIRPPSKRGPRCCGFCREIGHDARTCAKKRELDASQFLRDARIDGTIADVQEAFEPVPRALWSGLLRVGFAEDVDEVFELAIAHSGRLCAQEGDEERAKVLAVHKELFALLARVAKGS